jgi:glycosyltransferase involved in cell wall biosynthesis
MLRVLFFIENRWAFGSIHHELTKYLHAGGHVSDLVDWARSYTPEEFGMLARYYDRVVTVPGQTWPLTDQFGVPHAKIVVVAHGDADLHHVVATRPTEEIDRFAGYGVISDYLLRLSAELGIKRVPKIVRYGVNCRRFAAPISDKLMVVGYGGIMHRSDNGGVDWKRGNLAREASEDAGLAFNPAGQFHFLAMPQYYREVDAVLVSSSREGFGLPAMEAAAAGRLVISTPVGAFPELASEGAGITAPVDAVAFKDFVTERLNYFKENSAEYARTCQKIQDAVQRFDWEYAIDDWIALFSQGR